MVFHGHGQKRLRTIARALVKGARARKVESLLGIGVGNVHRTVVQGRMRRHQCIVGRTVGMAQRQVRQGDALPCGASLANAQGIGAHDLEMQGRVVFRHAVEGATIRAGQGFGRFEDVLQQPFDVALTRERRADAVELLQAAEQVHCRCLAHGDAFIASLRRPARLPC